MTTAPLSETAIANMGGLLLEEIPMTSISDGTSAYARFCLREFGFVRDELLRAHPWSMNRTMASVTTDTTPPPFRYKYSYTLPNDCLRLYTIRAKLNGPKVAYEKFRNKVYTDCPAPLQIIYGARITNVAEFDPLVARALGYRLGLMAAQLVTGKVNYVDKARYMHDEAMRLAVHVDSLEQGSDHYTDDGWNGQSLDSMNVRGMGGV